MRLLAADLVGRAIARLLTGGRLVLLTLIAAAASVLFLPITWWQALLGLGIVLLLAAALRAHVRVVIEGFEDYRYSGVSTRPQDDADAERGGKDAAEPIKDAGTAVLLANRLATMRELYGFVDDPDRTPTPDRPTGATVQLDDAATVLRSAVTTESTLSFGPISIPLGAAMGLIGRLVQAPRLRGAIHGDEHKIIVTAELVMDGQPYAWRVSSDVEDATTERRTLESIIDDGLAYQVFSDLTLQRQARWPATKFWLLALGNMTESQRRPRNRRLLLKEAEWNFMHALAEDERFYLACLNLGIVYRRLAQHPGETLERSQDYVFAARRAFERAITLRPDRWEAYHALAEAHWGTEGSVGALEMIAGLCERALSRKPDRAASARILDLKGQAEAAAPLAWGSAVATRRRACRLALKELARTRLRQASARQASRLEALENQASQCLVNLAWTSWNAHLHGGSRSSRNDHRAFRAAYGVARLAARVSDVDAAAHQRLAQLAVDTGQLDVAAKELSAAARIAPADPRYAAQLALVLALNHDHGRAAEACARAERLIDFADTEQKQAQDWLIHAYNVRGGDHLARATALETRKTLADELEACSGPAGHPTVAALEILLASLGEERDWERARLRAVLGRLIRDGPGDPDDRSRAAAEHFREALRWYEEHQPDDARLAELHSERAQTLALRPACTGEALTEAETAVILNPLSAVFRDNLARVYEVGGDLESACTAAEQALLLDPDDPALHHRAAMRSWKHAESVAEPAAHATARERASLQFSQALKLYHSDERAERRTTSWWLAMSYFAMSRFEEVPANLLFVLTSITSGAEATPEERGLQATAELWLGKTHRKLGKYLQAEAHSHEAVRAATQLDEQGVPLTQSLAGGVNDDRWPLWAVLALAHMQLAGCHADREGKLEEAESSLDAVHRLFERLNAYPEIDYCGTDTYADYRAERGRLLLAQDRAADAIAEFRRAVDIDPDEADLYLLLARAHVRAAEQQIEQDWQAHIRYGRAACRRTREIGGDHHPDTSQAAEVEKQLDRVEAIATRQSKATEGNGRRPDDALSTAAPSSQ